MRGPLPVTPDKMMGRISDVDHQFRNLRLIGRRQDLIATGQGADGHEQDQKITICCKISIGYVSPSYQASSKMAKISSPSRCL